MNDNSKNVEKLRGKIAELVKIVSALEEAYPGRHFTLDGHLVGSVGEVLAEYYYGVELHPTGTPVHDGKINGKEVQIKTTQRDIVLLGEEPDYLLVLYLANTGAAFEVYNGPGKFAWDSETNKDKRGYKHLRVNKLMELDAEVKDEDRIPQVNGIRKMRKELKNPKKLKKLAEAQIANAIWDWSVVF